MCRTTQFTSSVLILLLASVAARPSEVAGRRATGIAAQTPDRPGGLSATEKHGRQIYLLGTNPDDSGITALLNDVEVPAGVLPCANCHGSDGHGKPEGGIVPSDITWAALTKPYGVSRADGHRSPPYDDRALKMAISLGIDPAGNKLNSTMPRYRLSRLDMEALIAYLKRLDNVRDPGLSPDSLTLGVLLPSEDRIPGLSTSIRRVLEACFHQVNSSGGVFGRQVNLRFMHLGTDPLQSLRDFVAREEPFALTAGFLAGSEQETAVWLGQAQIPLVGAFSDYPQVEFPLNRYVFYLNSGIPQQALSLAAFASRLGPEGRSAAVLYAEGSPASEAARGLQEFCREAGWTKVEEIALDPWLSDIDSLAANLEESGATAVFFLGPGGLDLDLLAAIDRRGWKPYFLAPGSLTSRRLLEAPKSMSRRIFLAWPSAPSDLSASGLAEYQDLASRGGLSRRFKASQLTAFASAKVLLEALQRSGRDVTRESLITELEGLYKFETELGPAVTYGPNRRIGALGAHIVALDLDSGKVERAGDWVAID